MVSLFGLHHGEPAVVKSNSLLTTLKYNKNAIDSASQFTLVGSQIHDNSFKLHNNFGDTGKPAGGRGVRIKTIWMMEDATSLSCTTADFDPLEGTTPLLFTDAGEVIRIRCQRYALRNHCPGRRSLSNARA